MNKKAKLILGVTCGVILIAGVGFFTIKNTYSDKLTSDKVREQVIEKEKIKQDEEMTKIEENIAKNRLENARKKAKEAKKNKENINSEKLEGSLETDSSNSSSKPTKNDTQSSTGNTNKPSKKPPTTSKPNKPSKPNDNNSGNSGGSVPGFSNDEIINGGENEESRPPSISDDDTQVGEM